MTFSLISCAKIDGLDNANTIAALIGKMIFDDRVNRFISLTPECLLPI
jgi:hypothetical protein